MADVKISALPTGSALSGTEIIPAVQGGDTAKITVNQIKEKVLGGDVNFANIPTIPITDPTLDAHVASKKYVDAKDAQLGADLNENIEPSLAEILNAMAGRIIALESIIKNSVYKNMQVDTLDIVKGFSIYGSTNLVLTGTADPSVIPDFVGQFYVNTTGGVCYQAKGISSTSDWKQTSN